MKKQLLSAVMVCALGLAGCGGDDDTTPQPTVPKFDTADNIYNYLEGKKMVMEGNNIPTHPNGFNEDTNFGASTQCYNQVEITVASRVFHVDSDLGTLRNPTDPATSDCDRTTVSGNQKFDSTNVLIENVAADANCFDITVSFNGFSQSGRGKLSADGKTLTLELYLGTAHSGIRCQNGAVGSKSVSTSQGLFTGNAQQVYTVSAQ
ncbi:hypothetical protein [Hyalangium gracile]|uniref:hypothetical protein n=1 Tax=Hyalangium gracile TaxID=394092 RepID=UPI001CCD4389|nr:hypothetical protein [Hyalangium gracile]